MGLRDRLFNHPDSMIFGLLCWGPLAIMVYVMISWTVQGDIDPILGFVGAVLCVAVGCVAIAPPNEAIPEIILLGCLATLAGYPIMRSLLDRFQLAQVDVEAIERAYLALGQQPLNPSLRFRLAKLLYARGLVQEAVAVADGVMERLPTQFYQEEHREVHHWRSQIRGARKEQFECLNCHESNRRGEVFCQSCGQPLMLALAQGKYVGSQFVRQMMTIWLGILTLLVSVPLASSYLSPTLSALVIVTMVGLVVYFVLKALVPAQKEPQASAGEVKSELRT